MNNSFLNKIKKIYSSIYIFFKTKVLRDSHMVTINQWFKNNGDSTLRIDYSLDENSIVFDVGGYMGEWSENIINRYNPTVYIYEPIKKYYDQIAEKFKSNKKVLVCHFGLSDANKETNINLLEDASSIHGEGDKKETIRLVNFSDFIKEKNINKVDLIKINIEGAEYDLLEGMIKDGSIKICHNIQVQFHRSMLDSKNRRDKIRESLNKTHFITYDYPFVWENWRKK